MAAPRTTHVLRVRSYELRPDGCAGHVSFLNWFQEAAFANSFALGFDLERYAAMGVSWVMRESDLEITERPTFNEAIHITTWIADFQRVTSQRQYEAQREDGTVLARCNTQWVMIDLATQRPTRIPKVMQDSIQPARDFVLTPLDWPTVTGEPFVGSRMVAFYEEDEMDHVNNAVYLNWIEENARRAAQHAGLPMPRFRRHRLQYRLPARRDDTLTLYSTFAPHEDGLAWYHEIHRQDELLFVAWSRS